MRKTLIMLVGLPGSGKSTLGTQISCDYVCPHFSSDEIRKELTGSEECQDKDEEVFKILHKRIKDRLSEDWYNPHSSLVVYDACNINYKRRMAFLNEIKSTNCRKICIFVWTPYEKCLQNNIKRKNDGGRFVPEWVIERMYKNIYIPQYYEGWDEIFVYTGNECFDPTSRLFSKLFYGDNGLCKISHDNPHHTLSIGDHCLSCYLNTLDFVNGIDSKLSTAALLHDIGKPFTKAFKDSKGNPCETAHYYQHHLVSAYNAVPYLLDWSKNDMLEILALIQWHMFPYFWEKDNNKKMEKKYRNLWGEELYRKIMLLHIADEAAH